jgi:hypothetical protein
VRRHLRYKNRCFVLSYCRNRNNKSKSNNCDRLSFSFGCLRI